MFDPTDWYSDHDGSTSYDGNKISGNTEAIVSSNDDILNSSDVVRKTGLCLLELFDYSAGIGEQHIDNNRSDSYTGGEAVLRTATFAGEVHPGEIVRGGAADMTPFPSNIRFTDGINGNASPVVYNNGEAIISSDDGILDSSDTVLTPGNADLNPLPGHMAYSDFDGDGRYDGDEVIISDAGVQGQLDIGSLNGTGVDAVIEAGKADLRAMDGGLLFADDNGDGEFTPGELMVSSADTNVDVGEVIIPGAANLKPLSNPSVAGMLYSDNDNNNNYSDGELKIITDDTKLDAGDEVVAPGTAAMLSFRDDSSTWYVDADGGRDFDSDEAIVYEGSGDDIPYLDEDDEIARSGSVNIKSFADEVVYIDHNDDGDFQGDSDNDVNLDDSDDDTLANDPDVLNDQDEVVLKDATGPNHLALDAGDFVLRPGLARLTVFSETCMYVDDNSDGYFTPGELVIIDVNEPGSPNIATLTAFQRSEKFVDGNGNGIYDSGEAIVYDWYNASEGEFILAGDVFTPSIPGNGSLQYQTPGDRASHGDCVILASDPGSAAMIQFNDTAQYRYVDVGDTNVYDGFYTGNYEPIIWSANDQLEEGALDGTGIDHLLAAGYAGMRAWTGQAQNMAWTDDNHDGEYQSNEAIVNDAGGDGIITFIGAGAEDDQIIVPGDADLQAPTGTDHKYSDANNDNEYTDGELVIDDLNNDNNVDAGEIVIPGKANLTAFAADVMYIDHNGNNLYSDSEAIVRTGDAELGSDDEVLVTGAAGLESFAVNTYRFTDADHNGQYDQGEAIVVEAGWGAVDDVLEDSDLIALAGAADIEQFPSSFMFLDDGANSNAYEDGEALVNDSNGNSLLDTGEIVIGGRAALREFTGNEKYTDGGSGANTRNSKYDQDEAIILDGNYNGELDTGLLNGGGNDRVLSSGKAGFISFRDDENYVDSDGDGHYNGNEDIYLDTDGNGMVTLGDDGLEYFVVENVGTATNSDLSSVKLWADRDGDGQFEPNTDDAPAIADLIPDGSNAKMWYEGPAAAPPLSAASTRDPINQTIFASEQRLFVTVDIDSAPTDGQEIQMRLPINGAKTFFGSSGPSDAVITNAYTQKIDYANPNTAEITAPSTNAILDGLIALQADASDTLQVGKVEFYNGPPGGGNVPIAVDTDGAPWQATWDSSGVESGLYTLYARVYDRSYLRPPPAWGINHYTDSQGVQIIVSDGSYQVQLADGWNLISVPLEAFNTNIGSVISLIDGDCISFWGYDVTASEWLRYDVDEPDFLNDLDSVHMGVGYWVLMDGQGTLNIPGTIASTAISLKAGWNLVGCNSLVSLDVVDATGSIQCTFEVWTVDAATDEWLGYAPGDPSSDLDTIEPGRGYWFYVVENCTWDISQ